MGFYAKWKLNGNSSNLKEKHLNYVEDNSKCQKAAQVCIDCFWGQARNQIVPNYFGQPILFPSLSPALCVSLSLSVLLSVVQMNNLASQINEINVHELGPKPNGNICTLRWTVDSGLCIRRTIGG